MPLFPIAQSFAGIMTGVKESVKELLVGSTEEPQPSVQIKENFIRHAQKDEATGELYMTENEFINAIAPSHEDYVSVLLLTFSFFYLPNCD